MRPAISPPLLALSFFAASAAAQTPVHTIDGDDAFDIFGWSVSGAGDMNGDGIPDFLVGAIDSFPIGANPGYARAFSGLDASVLHTFVGTAPGGFFGYSVSGAGDFDADGYADVIIGAPREDTTALDAGSARVYSGFDYSVIATLDGDDANDGFGFSVSGAGDVDADSYGDVIVGAPFDDDNGPDSGSASVVSGRTGAVIHRFDGDAAGDEFGSAVSGAGDVNADGYADLIVGAPQDGIGTGYARVFSGVDGTEMFTVTGDTAGDLFGSSVACAGDVDMDGEDEVIVGAPADDPQTTGFPTGSIQVYSGPIGALVHQNVGFSDDSFGTSVAGVGDVDGDGYDDYASGARHELISFHPGRFEIHSGLTGDLIHQVFGSEDDSFFGHIVSGVGDLTGDGVPEILVGAYRQDTAAQDAGRAVVFSGVCSGPENYCTGAPNSVGPGASMSWSGSFVHSDNQLTVEASGAPPGQFGFFVYAREPGQVTLGDGFLCVDGTNLGIFRLTPAELVDANGDARRPVDHTVPPSFLHGKIRAGSTMYFQFWYRDPAGPGGNGFNLSDGLRVTFCP